MNEDGYPNGRAFVQALKASAKSTHPHAMQERIQQLWFDRFLCRVFASDARDDWTLKGGIGLLARISGGRGTRDIDFTVAHKPIDVALEELREIALQDLGDHVSFEMYRTGTMIEGQGDHIEGRRAYFVGYADGREQCRFHVDVVAAPPPVGTVDVLTPVGRAAWKQNVPTADYRVFPVEDHLAEKVGAMLAHARGDENTRVKDLADVLMIMRTQNVDAQAFSRALGVTLERAGAALPDGFVLPEGWRATFPSVVQGTIIEGMEFDIAVAEARQQLGAILTEGDSREGGLGSVPAWARDTDLQTGGFVLPDDGSWPHAAANPSMNSATSWIRPQL